MGTAALLGLGPPRHHELPPSHPLSPTSQYIQALHSSPTSSLRLQASHAEYLSAAARIGELQHQAAQASLDVPFSLDASRLGSPSLRASMRANRKRALSASPYSSELDLNTMIRFSPTSLLLTGSRSSSTSGSYGHLSAGAASPALVHPTLQSAHLQQLQQLQSHTHELRRSAELRSSPLLSPQNSLLHSSPALHSAQTGYFPVFGTSGSPFTPVGKDPKDLHNISKPESSSNVVSSTMDDDDKSGIKLEAGATSARDCGEDGKEEPDFIETHCHWTDCDKEYGTQDDLVKHIANDHIHANKKSFICQWKECNRQEKPM